MRRKLTIGWVIFVTGILLQIVSDTTDIWIIGFLGGILWPVGMVLGINALISLKHKKQDNDLRQQLMEAENKQRGDSLPNDDSLPSTEL